MARFPVTRTGLATVGKPATATGSGKNERASSELWTPEDLGADVVAWWDVYDRGTVIYNGDYVDTLLDKTSNNHDLSQVVPSKQPKWVEHAISNSFEGIEFDGIDDRMKNSTMVLPQPFSVVQLFRTDDTQAEYASSFGGDFAIDALIYIRNRDFSDHLCLSAGNIVDTGLTVSPSQNQILVAQFNNATSSAALNGIEAATPNTGTFGISAGPSI